MEEDGPTEISSKSCILWVPRGIAARNPVNDVFTELADEHESGDLSAVEQAKLNISKLRSDGPEQLLSIKKGQGDISCDDYDKDTDPVGGNFFGVLPEDVDFARENPDEYDADEVDFTIKPHEFVVVVGSIDRNMDGGVETYSYKHNEGATYLHHDTITREIPLSLEWLQSYKDMTNKHIYALGSFSTSIEIWNNDVVNTVEPIDTLEGHEGPVSSLHRNQLLSNILLSSSFDHSVRLWDTVAMKEQSCYPNWHKDKVYCAKWHPSEGSLFATCGEDGAVHICDMRVKDTCLTYEAGISVGEICWYRHSQFTLIGVGEQGTFFGIDVRQIKSDSKANLWSITDPEAGHSSITDCSVPGVIVTGGEDGIARVWDASVNPILEVASKDLHVNHLVSVACSPDPYLKTLFAFGGSELAIWDLSSVSHICERFHFD